MPAERFPFHIDIYLTNGNYLGRTSNVSRTGFFIPSGKPQDYSEDRVYPIVIQTNNNRWPIVYALAEIRWRKEGPVGGHGFEIFPSNKETMIELMDLIKVETSEEMRKQRIHL
jgi:hypothetical protein